jgi:hypothetical protein
MTTQKSQKNFMGKKIDVPIVVFEVMYGILEKNKYQERDWAEASGVLLGRISEFKRIAGETKTGATEITKPFLAGHRFSVEKCIELWRGLEQLVGGMELQSGLIKQLDQRDLPTRARIFLRLLAFNDAQIKQVDMLTDAILKSHVYSGSNQNEN